MVGILEKIGIAVCAGFLVLAAISFILPATHEMTGPGTMGYSPPSSQHILGTDFMGRDLFTQLCSGAYYAFSYGIVASVMGISFLVCAAFLLGQLRSETPQLTDTPLTRYVRFVAFPLGVTGFFCVLMLLLGTALGRVSLGIILLLDGLFGFCGWLAVGHDMEMRFRKGGKIPVRLLLSGGALILSYTVLYYGFLNFLGLGDPSSTTWGMMIQWCFTSGYTFRAPYWLIPPILCIYIFSRGMLALSYGIYSSGPKNT